MKALARLCRAFGEQSRQRRAGKPTTADEVAEMVRLATEAFVIEPREPVREWLGTYLRDRRGAAWATDDHLATEAGLG